MLGTKFFLVFTTLAFPVALATADIDDFQCQSVYEYDASVKGTVSSPFYGERPYHNDLRCEYIIRAPQGHRIKITFKDLDIDPSVLCVQDKLTVSGKDSDNPLGVYCGYELPKPILSKEGESEIRILFQSDFMAAGRGFLLEYESSPNMRICDHGYVQCTNRNCYKPEQKCDGVDNCGDGTDEENCNRPIALFPEECGAQHFKPKTVFDPDRMVGGEAVVPNSWPWQVSLQMNLIEPNGHFCGGTLINAQWVLTAAHCVLRVEGIPGDTRVVLGAHGKYTKTPYEHVRYVAKWIVYPNLEGEDIEKMSIFDDLSLIKLNAPVTFNEGVQPACLAQLGRKAEPGWHCYATGWGETRGSGFDDTLKQTEQVIQPPQNCRFNEKTQICVEKPQNSACHGDSGGPLQCKIGDKWYVFGAVSYATTFNFFTGICTGPGAMTIYANAADKADWIKDIIKENS